MKTGDIVLIPFPYAEWTKVKVRPAVVICHTQDSYRDLVICAISSIVPARLSAQEMLIEPDKLNKLKVRSIIKVDRIVTLKATDVITRLGKLKNEQIDEFKIKFKKLVD